LTKSMYIQKIKEATASVKAGNHTTVEDLRPLHINHLIFK